MGDTTGDSGLLKFILLAKSAKGKGVVAVIQQALQNPQTFVFGELLDVPSVRALAEGENKQWYDTLALFAYGTYADYKAAPQNFAELSPALQKKLKQLSIVSLASSQKSLPYSLLLGQLEIGNVRELEDLIIDSIYVGIIKGKLDQKEQRFQVDWSMGRDIRPGQLQEMIKILDLWCEKSETLMSEIKERIQYANLSHEEHQRQKKEFETRVEDIKANLKATLEADLGGAGDYADVDFGFDSANKKSRAKIKGPGGLIERHRRR